MQVWSVILVAIVVGTGVPVVAHSRTYGVLNAVQIALAFFLWLNVIIALWEMCLLARIDHIAREHEALRAKYKGREMARVKEFLGRDVTLASVFSPALWGDLWATYAVYDDSYADKKSFGFFIDVGNGFTTIVPCLLYLYAMTSGAIPARAMGVVGVLLFYQMWYGTLVYLGSYFLNGRHKGRHWAEVAVMVILMNGVWFTFPILGMYASIHMIYTDSYALFLR